MVVLITRLSIKLSVSSNGSTWVKLLPSHHPALTVLLSVSSNGSTWVKLGAFVVDDPAWKTFSILERIDVGETKMREV